MKDWLIEMEAKRNKKAEQKKRRREKATKMEKDSSEA